MYMSPPSGLEDSVFCPHPLCQIFSLSDADVPTSMLCVYISTHVYVSTIMSEYLQKIVYIYINVYIFIT